MQEADEIRKLGCSSDMDLLEYFRKKHNNKEKSDPNKNLSCISWRPPVEDVASSEKGEEDQVMNRDDLSMNSSEKVKQRNIKIIACCLVVDLSIIF